MSEPVWHRIHPLTMVLELWNVAKRFFLVIGLLIYELTSGRNTGEIGVEAVAAGLGVLVIVPAVIRYFTYGYAIHQGKLLVRSGLITKNLRTIPLDRIQNINLSRNLLHRVLGLVDLDIETASSAKAEASISALNEEQARILKAQLLREKPRLTSFVQDERNKKVVYKPTPYEIFLVGASENKLGAIIAAVMGLSFVGPAFQNYLAKNATHLSQSLSAMKGSWIFLSVAIVGMLLVGWITSIVQTFIKYFDFELTEDGEGKLRRSYGLLNHVENVLPVSRVQTVVLKQNLIQRALRIAKLYVSTAGGFGSHKKGEQNQTEIHHSPLLTPVMRESAFPQLLHTVLPNEHLVEPKWSPVSPKTVWRHMRSMLLPALILSTLPAVLPSLFTSGEFAFKPVWQCAAVFVFFELVALYSGFVHAKFAKWDDVDNVVVSTVGWFSRRRHYLPSNKVQAVTVRQSLVQRYLGLASVDLSSAAPTFQHTEIDDLPADVAEMLALRVHEVSAAGHDTLVDGF